jgi:hypothetical protein
MTTQNTTLILIVITLFWCLAAIISGIFMIITPVGPWVITPFVVSTFSLFIGIALVLISLFFKQ